MASLKTLRNRIASVKATQKITKAMQMVAASKLRRAQAAAEAARPYAERMATVLATSPRRSAARADAPPLLAGTGKRPDPPARRLHGRSRPVRRLQLVDRAARPRPCPPPHGRGQGSQDLLRRQARATTCSAAHLRRSRSSRSSSSAPSSRSASPTPTRSARRCWRCSPTAQFDVCTLFYAEFRSVISQIPTARQLIPAQITAPARRSPAPAAPSTNTSRTRRAILADLLPRNLSIQIFRALLENVASEQGAKMSAMDNATRNAGDMIDRYTLLLQPQPPGADHQGTDRDHLGRRGALSVSSPGVSKAEL